MMAYILATDDASDLLMKIIRYGRDIDVFLLEIRATDEDGNEIDGDLPFPPWNDPDDKNDD